MVRLEQPAVQVDRGLAHDVVPLHDVLVPELHAQAPEVGRREGQLDPDLEPPVPRGLAVAAPPVHVRLLRPRVADLRLHVVVAHLEGHVLRGPHDDADLELAPLGPLQRHGRVPPRRRVLADLHPGVQLPPRDERPVPRQAPDLDRLERVPRVRLGPLVERLPLPVEPPVLQVEPALAEDRVRRPPPRVVPQLHLDLGRPGQPRAELEALVEVRLQGGPPHGARLDVVAELDADVGVGRRPVLRLDVRRPDHVDADGVRPDAQHRQREQRLRELGVLVEDPNHGLDVAHLAQRRLGRVRVPPAPVQRVRLEGPRVQVLLELAGLLVEPPLAAVDEVGGGPLRGEVDVQVLERVLGLARRLADVRRGREARAQRLEQAPPLLALLVQDRLLAQRELLPVPRVLEDRRQAVEHVLAEGARAAVVAARVPADLELPVDHALPVARREVVVVAVAGAERHADVARLRVLVARVVLVRLRGLRPLLPLALLREGPRLGVVEQLRLRRDVVDGVPRELRPQVDGARPEQGRGAHAARVEAADVQPRRQLGVLGQLHLQHAPHEEVRVAAARLRRRRRPERAAAVALVVGRGHVEPEPRPARAAPVGAPQPPHADDGDLDPRHAVERRDRGRLRELFLGVALADARGAAEEFRRERAAGRVHAAVPPRVRRARRVVRELREVAERQPERADRRVAPAHRAPVPDLQHDVRAVARVPRHEGVQVQRLVEERVRRVGVRARLLLAAAEPDLDVGVEQALGRRRRQVPRLVHVHADAAGPLVRELLEEPEVVPPEVRVVRVLAQPQAELQQQGARVLVAEAAPRRLGREPVPRRRAAHLLLEQRRRGDAAEADVAPPGHDARDDVGQLLEQHRQVHALERQELVPLDDAPRVGRRGVLQDVVADGDRQAELQRPRPAGRPDDGQLRAHQREGPQVVGRRGRLQPGRRPEGEGLAVGHGGLAPRRPRQHLQGQQDAAAVGRGPGAVPVLGRAAPALDAARRPVQVVPPRPRALVYRRAEERRLDRAVAPRHVVHVQVQVRDGAVAPAPDVVRQANGHAPELDRLGDREPELLAELRVGPAPARLRPAGRAARLRDDVALEQVRREEVPLRGRQVLRLPAVHDEERQARGRQRRPAQGDAPPLLLLPLQLPLVLRVEVVGPLLVAGPEHGHGALEEALVAVVRAVRRVDEPDPLAVELVVRERVDLPQVEARAPDRRVPADGVVVQDGDVDGGRLGGRRRQVRQGEVQHVVEDARRHLFHDARLALAAVDAHARVGVAQPVQVLRLEVPALDDVDLHGVVAGLHGRGAAALELVDDAPGHHGARAPPLVQLLLLPRREVLRREGVLLEQPVLLRPLVPVLRALRTSP